jgi:hypothetical protein
MTADQFRQAVNDLDLGKDLFCFLTGSNPANYLRWLKGETDIPPWVPAFLVLMTLPGARDLAYRTAQHFFIQEEEPTDAID